MSGLEKEPLAGCCERGIKPSGSVKGEEFFDGLSFLRRAVLRAFV
jgi:hypothetical protein